MSDVGIGSVLREERQERGWTIEDVGQATSMRMEQVRALEADEFAIFGGDVYAKGFVRTYARHLGLDPEPLVERYRSRVQADGPAIGSLSGGSVSADPRPEIAPWVLRAAAALLVVGVGAVLLQFVGSRAPDPADDVAADATAPPEAVSSETASADPSADAQASASPSPSSEPVDGVAVTLAFEEDSWVRVTVDGSTVQEGLISQNEALQYDADESVLVRAGNAGGVRALLNGESVGLLGDDGVIADWRFTEDGAEQGAEDA